jgi:hypothetical protein
LFCENSRRLAYTFSQEEGVVRVASFESPRATTRAPQGAIDIPTCAAQPFPIQNYCLTEIVKDGKGRPIMANHGVITKDHHDAYYKECKMPAD